MPVYKLTYFDIRAKAEVARLMFAYQGQNYEDFRVSKEEWIALKPQTPFGQLPTLEIDGKVYSESVAINNHLARQFGLYGKKGIDMLKIDQVVEMVQDVWRYIIDWIHASGKEAQDALQKANKETHFPRYLGNFEKLLRANESGFYVGEQLSYADIAVFDVLDIQVPESLIEQYPHVKANRDKVKNHDRLKEYISTRKDAAL